MANTDPIESFFKDEVERAFKAEGLQVVGATGPYLARLLTSYAAQPIEDRPLGVRFFEALAAGCWNRARKLANRHSAHGELCFLQLAEPRALPAGF